MSDEGFDNLYLPHDPQQRALALAYYRRQAAEQREIDRRAQGTLDANRQPLEVAAEKHGLTHQEDKHEYAETIARLAAEQGKQPRDLGDHKADEVAMRIWDARDATYQAEQLRQQKEAEQLRQQKEIEQQAEAERRAAEQVKQEQKSAAARAEPLPGSVNKFDAAIEERAALNEQAQLAQRQQLNNADMVRLAERGPHRPDYSPLRQPSAAQQPPERLSADQVANRFGDDRLKALYDRANEPKKQPAAADRGHVAAAYQNMVVRDNLDLREFLQSNLVTRKSDKGKETRDRDDDRDNTNQNGNSAHRRPWTR